MSESDLTLPPRPSLVQLRKQARELLLTLGPEAKLAEAQLAVARRYGFPSWARLKRHVEALRPVGLARYEAIAEELAAAFAEKDAAGVREVNWSYGTSFAWDPDPERQGVDAARRMVAHCFGFESWEKFAAGFERRDGVPHARPPFYEIDWRAGRLSVRGPQSRGDWDTICSVLREHGIRKVRAGGTIDAALERLAKVEGITHLEVSGSNELTDRGARFIGEMASLRELELGGWKSPITDRALEGLKNLRELRVFQACWTQGISDTGLANLADCEWLENVNLLGTPAGDGTLAALRGKRFLRRLSTGRAVTDAGLAMLHEIPAFTTWQGGERKYGLMEFGAEPTHLVADGPFTDAGLAGMAGLDGLFGLTFFWHCQGFTSAGLAGLRKMANLGFLGCQDAHCDDEAMRQIAAIPGLRMLMGQGAVAGDEGFAALSESRTLEYLWGRECPNLGGTGFAALAEMPALRGIGVSCRNVEDAALATLPGFPALRELMPMDVSDAGFRHVGRCENLEGLWCMYCRETGDAATEEIAGLRKLRTYYAGKTRITDRSLEILAGMDSLEQVELWECGGVTDAGVARLAALPRLRRVQLSGLANVTRGVVGLFPDRVRVEYSG